MGQTGVPVVPTRLTGNAGVGFLPTWPRKKILVRFGAPVLANPGLPEEALRARLESSP